MKHVRNRILGVAVVLMVVSQVAHADILFIDLNCSPDEIAAAQLAAKARGESLVLFPKRTPEQQKLYGDFHQAEMRQEAEQIAEGKICGDQPNSQACNNIHASVTRAGDVYTKASQQLGQYMTNNNSARPMYSDSDLDAVLTEESKKGKGFDSIVISGHHVGSYFGQFGQMSESQVANAFKNHPDLLKKVRSYYGWGCYSATKSEALQWEGSFPNLEVVGGFEGSAPGGGMKAGSEYLTNALEKEKTLIEESDEKNASAHIRDIAAQIKAIPGFRDTTAAMCTRAACVGMESGTTDFSKLAETCDPSMADDLATRSMTLGNILGNRSDVPCDTQNSPLRQYYNRLRLLQHCGEAGNPSANQFSFYTSRVDEVLRRIYFNQVLKNFELYYQADLKRVSDAFSQCMPNQKIPDFTKPGACSPDSEENASYVHTNDIWQSTGEIGLLSQMASCQLTDDDRQSARRMIAAIASSLVNLQSQCIPASWVDSVRNASELTKPADECAGN